MSDVMQSSVNRSLRRIEIPAASPRRAQPESFRGLQIPWPDGLAPKPVAIDPAPSPDDPLPRVDVIAMVDTVAEAEATSDVLTPGVYYTGWYRYARNFATVFQPQLGPNAPADREPYLGLYYLMELAGLRVLVYKTNLHMHTDGKKLPDGSYTLPIRDMLAQMIADAKPKFFLTTGTSGGVALPRGLVQTFVVLGQATVPMLLFVVGSTFSLAGLSRLDVLAPVLAIRLGMGVAVGLVAAHLVGLDGELAAATVLVAMAPSVAVGIAISERFKLDSELFTAALTATTVLYVLLAPLLAG